MAKYPDKLYLSRN